MPWSQVSWGFMGPSGAAITTGLCIPMPPPTSCPRTLLQWTPHFGENFRGLVLGCMGTYDSESRRILSHFSRSTRFPFLCTAPHSNMEYLLTFRFYFTIFPSSFFFFKHFESISSFFAPILMKISQNFTVEKNSQTFTRNLKF